MSQFLKIISVCVFSFVIVGCGQMGPLYLPAKDQSVSSEKNQSGKNNIIVAQTNEASKGS